MIGWAGWKVGGVDRWRVWSAHERDAVHRVRPCHGGPCGARAGELGAGTRLFEQAVACGDAAEAWEGLSRAAWWQGDQDVVFVARERAYRCYQQRADACSAARMAMWLASDHLDFLGDDAVATAWLRRARSLTGDLAPCPEQGYNLLLEADIALLCESDPATAMTKAREAVELAGRIPDVGVEVVGLAILGSALVALGAVEEGLQRLDECATLAVAEDFSEIAAPG